MPPNDILPAHAASEPSGKVTLIEVGLRDGLQSEARILPTAAKLELIHALLAAGITTLQAGSFVSPKRIPQMADADRLFPLLPPREGVVYNALVLSPAGLTRALKAGVSSVELSVSASNSHSLANIGKSREKALAEVLEMIRIARGHGVHVRAGIQCVFGCAFEGEISPKQVLATAEIFLDAGIQMLALSDTIGAGTPETVHALVREVNTLAGEIPVVLHFHDARGMGLTNVRAAIEEGVTHFDTALGGIGGCPAVPNAPGNIATGGTARMLAAMDIPTGLDVAKIDRCAARLKAFLAGGGSTC